jgi:hypothetical protein
MHANNYILMDKMYECCDSKVYKGPKTDTSYKDMNIRLLYSLTEKCSGKI